MFHAAIVSEMGTAVIDRRRDVFGSVRIWTLRALKSAPKCLCWEDQHMNILEMFESFKTQEQAIEYFERARWTGGPICPYCKKDTVCRHASGDRSGPRWPGWSCKRAFAGTVGTIFHG